MEVQKEDSCQKITQEQQQQTIKWLFEQQDQHQKGKMNKNQTLKLFDNFNQKAICGKQAYLYCSNQQCEQNPSICNPSCNQCLQIHQKCIRTVILPNLLNKIQCKSKKLDEKDLQILQSIEKKSDKMVDNISDMMHSLKQQIKIFGMSQIDRKLTLQILNHQNPQNFNSNKNEFFQIIKGSKQIETPHLSLNGELINYFLQTYSQSQNDWFQYSFKTMKSIINKFKQIILSQFQLIQEKLLKLHIKNKNYVSTQNYFTNSKIIKNPPLQQTNTAGNNNNNNTLSSLQNFLSKINLQKSSFQKIFSYCSLVNEKLPLVKSQITQSIENRKDLLFLIKNSHNKTFGFFTPLKFNASSDQKWLYDEKNETIVFSFDKNYISKLVDPLCPLRYVHHEHSQTDTIFIGGQPENNLKNNKTGIYIFLSSQPKVQFTAYSQNSGIGIFSNSSISYQDLNGFKPPDSIYKPLSQIFRLQIYQVTRNQKPQNQFI